MSNLSSAIDVLELFDKQESMEHVLTTLEALEKVNLNEVCEDIYQYILHPDVGSALDEMYRENFDQNEYLSRMTAAAIAYWDADIDSDHRSWDDLSHHKQQVTIARMKSAIKAFGEYEHEE